MPKVQLMEDDWRELRARLLEETKGFARVADAVDHVLMEFGMGRELTDELDAALAELQRLGQECEREADRVVAAAIGDLLPVQPVTAQEMALGLALRRFVMRDGVLTSEPVSPQDYYRRPEPVAEVEGVTEDA